MTIVESLQAISGYPISMATILNALSNEGIEDEAAFAEIDSAIRESEAYKKAKAQVYMYLATAPNVSQNGISYSLTNEDKAVFRSYAQNILDELGEDNGTGVTYGYQGDNY